MMVECDKPCDQIDQEVDRAAMVGILNLADILRLISNGFDDGSFPEEENAHDSE